MASIAVIQSTYTETRRLITTGAFAAHEVAIKALPVAAGRGSCADGAERKDEVVA